MDEVTDGQRLSGRRRVRTKGVSLSSAGLVHRCVIIQKDEHGFGFTVSGDRIVLVQSVRPGEEKLWASVGGWAPAASPHHALTELSCHQEQVGGRGGGWAELNLEGSWQLPTP